MCYPEKERDLIQGHALVSSYVKEWTQYFYFILGSDRNDQKIREGVMTPEIKRLFGEIIEERDLTYQQYTQLIQYLHKKRQHSVQETRNTGTVQKEEAISHKTSKDITHNFTNEDSKKSSKNILIQESTSVNAEDTFVGIDVEEPRETSQMYGK